LLYLLKSFYELRYVYFIGETERIFIEYINSSSTITHTSANSHGDATGAALNGDAARCA